MDRLPDEILLQIVKRLTTYELIQFCKATDKYYFLQERNLVREINLAGQFEAHTLPLCEFLLNNVHYVCTETLNVSYLYWIKSTELNRIINRMINLRELIAVDTNLELHELMRPKFLKLTKLALSLKRDEITRCPCMENNLKSLYIQINGMPFHSARIIELVGDFTNLEEIWICNDEDDGQRINYSTVVDKLKNLKKLVIKTYNLLSDFSLTHLGLHKTFDRKSVTTSILIFERVVKPNVTQPTESREHGIWELWNKINEFHDYVPCGVKECRQLFFNPDINQIYFEELNFADDPFECRSEMDGGINSRCVYGPYHINCKTEEYYKAVLELLCSNNASHLKRLAIRACNCLYLSSFNKSPTRKRKRTDDGRPLIFHKIGNNIRNLKVLEILQCADCHGESDFLTHYMIDVFGTLEKVTLPVQMVSRGSFLKEMFVKCPRLYSVNINCDDGCTNFINCLCQSLQYGKNLRDFRLDFKAEDLSDIVNALGSISSKKLLRVVLKCKTLLEFYGELFTSFVESNPQLIFLYVAVSEAFVHETTFLQETFDKLRRGNQTKVFLVKPIDTDYFLDAPAAHRDMLLNRTNVAVVNLEDF